MYYQGIRADVVAVDPPRKGCDERLLQTIVEMDPNEWCMFRVIADTGKGFEVFARAWDEGRRSTACGHVSVEGTR